jgi:DNA-binding transcriptional ArsR family regulator
MAAAATEWERAVLSLLDDEYARRILVATSAEPRSASELAELCDASEPTVYRRLDRLDEQGLIEKRQELDPDGHHYKTYLASVERVSVDIDPDGIVIEIVERERDPADRFTELYEGLR